MNNPYTVLAIRLAFLLFILVLLIVLTHQKKVAGNRKARSISHLNQAVFGSLKIGLLIMDDRGNVRFINPACRAILRTDKEKSLAGMPYTALIDPVLIPIAEKLTTAIENSEQFSREYRVYLSEGILCLQCDFYTFPDITGGMIYVLSLEDKTVEDDFKKKLSLQLEENHRYAVSKDNFFANMSHEIRTPINAILGMTYFAKNCADLQKIQDYIRKIDNASELLLGVVNDILDFSKMQEHKFSLKPENYDLHDIKKILEDLFILKAEQKGLTLSIDFDCPEQYIVNGDQFRLTQVFMNLVSNALKFTEKGCIAVSLNHEVIGKDVVVRCTVRDTGCGISEEEMTKLFIEFEQFGQVLVKNHEGTGLGLAISKRLVELMHGVIWVDSTPGNGTSFHFVVVLGRPESVEVKSFSRELPRIVLTSGRVLVVEDNEINAEIAGTLLAESGCIADYAADGLEAVERCRSLPPDYYDLILMDIHMPRMNGYDAARILKTEQHVTCPVLAVTATSETTELLEANRDIIAGYLLKPYPPAAFKSLFASI